MEQGKAVFHMSLVYVGFVPHPPIIVPEIGHGKEINSQSTIQAFQNLAEEVVKMMLRRY
jgi:hypothetical protein